jgi:hypothetical protein
LAATLYVAPAAGRTTLPTGCQAAAFTDINAAISAAVAGDNVIVCPGTYSGSVTIVTSSKAQPTITTGVEINKSVNVVGLPGAIISAAGLDNGVTFYDASYARLQGFTITGAFGEGVFAVVSTKITVADNVIKDNDAGTATSGYAECKTATGSMGNCGYGVHLLSITHSVVLENTVEFNSGGILLTDDYGPTYGNTIKGNLVEDNDARSGIKLAGDSATAVRTSGSPTPRLGGVYSNTVSDNVVISNGTAGYTTSTGTTAYGVGIVLTASVKGGASYDNLVSGNEIDGNGLSGVRIDRHYALSDVSGDLIVSNWIGTNDVSGAFTSGILIGRDSPSFPPVSVTVYDNTITFNHYGLLDDAGPGLTHFGNHYVKDVIDIEL